MRPRFKLRQALFVVGAVIALFLDQGNAALILAGVALGAAAVSTVALAPVADLLRKSEPLALPLLVIAVVGSIEQLRRRSARACCSRS